MDVAYRFQDIVQGVFRRFLRRIAQVVDPRHEEYLPGLSAQHPGQARTDAVGNVGTDPPVFHPGIVEEFVPFPSLGDAVADHQDVVRGSRQVLYERIAFPYIAAQGIRRESPKGVQHAGAQVGLQGFHRGFVALAVEPQGRAVVEFGTQRPFPVGHRRPQVDVLRAGYLRRKAVVFPVADYVGRVGRHVGKDADDVHPGTVRGPVDSGDDLSQTVGGHARAHAGIEVAFADGEEYLCRLSGSYIVQAVVQPREVVPVHAPVFQPGVAVRFGPYAPVGKIVPEHDDVVLVGAQQGVQGASLIVIRRVAESCGITPQGRLRRNRQSGSAQRRAKGERQKCVSGEKKSRHFFMWFYAFRCRKKHLVSPLGRRDDAEG